MWDTLYICRGMSEQNTKNCSIIIFKKILHLHNPNFSIYSVHTINKKVEIGECNTSVINNFQIFLLLTRREMECTVQNNKIYTIII